MGLTAIDGLLCRAKCGRIDHREDRQRYEAAIPGAVLSLCRLRATPETQRSRILYRGRLAGAGTDGAVNSLTMDGLSAYADRSATFAAMLDRDDIADYTASVMPSRA